MRRLVTAVWAAALLLLSLLGVGGAGAETTSPAPVTNTPVLAYYYQWFNASSWDRAKVDYPLVGRYSSDDTAVMRRHVQQAQQAGINGFIVSWKDSPTNNRRLKALMGVANESHFKLAIIYQGLDFQRDPLPVSRIITDLDYFNRHYASDPAFKIFAKPLLIWSGTWKFSTADLERTTRPFRSSLFVLATEKSPAGYFRVARSFDGDAYYWSSVDPWTNGGYKAKLNAMSSAVHQMGGLWIAPFAPGFDARMVGGRREVLRRSDETLRVEYNAAVSSSPDALGLISWNEFSENTQVEPSEKYGDAALTALAHITEGRKIVVSPLAAGSDDQGNESGNSMTVQTGLLLLVVLFALVTAVSWGRRPRAVVERVDAELDTQPQPVDRRSRRLFTPMVVIAGIIILLLVVSLVVTRRSSTDVTAPSPLYLGGQPVKDAGSVVIGAAGDISCPTDPRRTGEESGPNSCKMRQTADLLKSLNPDAVLALGDNQYPSGSLKDFQDGYDHSWGAFRAKTYPVAGNHEYGTPDAQGYFSYFGSRAGEPGKGYYSYDLGSWHVIALNSECEHVGGCTDTSPQALWLKQDLAAHPRACTLAYWHRPRFSSGNHGNNLDNDVLWRTLADAHADVVLNGHDHDYERFAPMDADGNVDDSSGTSELVVGTGGASHYKFHLPMASSLVRITGENGILQIKLTDSDYAWEFIRSSDRKVLDSGSARCR